MQRFGRLQTLPLSSIIVVGLLVPYNSAGYTTGVRRSGVKGRLGSVGQWHDQCALQPLSSSLLYTLLLRIGREVLKCHVFVMYVVCVTFYSSHT